MRDGGSEKRMIQKKRKKKEREIKDEKDGEIALRQRERKGQKNEINTPLGPHKQLLLMNCGCFRSEPIPHLKVRHTMRN